MSVKTRLSKLESQASTIGRVVWITRFCLPDDDIRGVGVLRNGQESVVSRLEKETLEHLCERAKRLCENLGGVTVARFI